MAWDEIPFAGYEVAPGLLFVNPPSSQTFPPLGFDPRVWVWTVPRGVSSLTIYAVGGLGGYRMTDDPRYLPEGRWWYDVPTTGGEQWLIQSAGTASGNLFSNWANKQDIFQGGDATNTTGGWALGAGGGAATIGQRVAGRDRLWVVAGGGGGSTMAPSPSSPGEYIAGNPAWGPHTFTVGLPTSYGAGSSGSYGYPGGAGGGGHPGGGAGVNLGDAGEHGGSFGPAVSGTSLGALKPSPRWVDLEPTETPPAGVGRAIIMCWLAPKRGGWHLGRLGWGGGW